MRAMPTACRSPLMTNGARLFIEDIAVSSRSCCAIHPDCQYGFGVAVVILPASLTTSGYHSIHLPALHPGGFDGAWTRCVTSLDAVRARSHCSTDGSRNTALGPPSVIVRLTS